MSFFCYSVWFLHIPEVMAVWNVFTTHPGQHDRGLARCDTGMTVSPESWEEYRMGFQGAAGMVIVWGDLQGPGLVPQGLAADQMIEKVDLLSVLLDRLTWLGGREAGSVGGFAPFPPVSSASVTNLNRATFERLESDLKLTPESLECLSLSGSPLFGSPVGGTVSHGSGRSSSERAIKEATPSRSLFSLSVWI
jgi:hypothetical protein